MQTRLIDIVVRIQMDGDLAMPLDTGNGREFDQSAVGHGVAFLVKGVPQQARRPAEGHDDGFGILRRMTAHQPPARRLP